MKNFFFAAMFAVLAFLTLFAVFGNEIEIRRAPAPPWIGIGFVGEDEHLAAQSVPKGTTFAQVAESFGMSYEDTLAVVERAKDLYNLEKIVEGREISFISGKLTGEPRKLIYQIDSEEMLVLRKVTDPAESWDSGEINWTAERLPIPHEIKLEEIKGEIDSSLFETIVESGGDERVALALAEMFAWQIDFAADIRAGDKFKMVYEKRFLNGNYKGPGNVLAAWFVNNKEIFRGIYFRTSGGKDGFYDLGGLSLQKIFLKSPLSYKFISSGFSYSRLNPVTRSDWGPHRAIDYAADYGAPVVTVGDGTVASAGWHGGLGNAVFVRHNDTYTTVYAHLSRFAVRTGSRVKQGQVVGHVGATGYATGPHLHFELRKFGARVNPLTIELPPGGPVPEEDRAAFGEAAANFQSFFEDAPSAGR